MRWILFAVLAFLLMASFNCKPQPRYFLVCADETTIFLQEVPDSVTGVRLATELEDTQHFQNCAAYIIQ